MFDFAPFMIGVIFATGAGENGVAGTRERAAKLALAPLFAAAGEGVGGGGGGDGAM